MNLIRPSLKVLSVWVALFLGLYLIIASLISYDSKSNAVLDLLQQKSQFIYGQDDNDNSNLSFSLDEYGEAAIFLPKRKGVLF